MIEEIELQESAVGGNSDIEMAKEDAVYLNGKKLESFAGRRLFAANCMGMRVFRLTAEQREAIKDGDVESYDGALLDIAIVLYLCSQPLSVTYKALRLPGKALENATIWAEENRIHPGGKLFAEAAEAFSELVTPILDEDANQEASPEDTELSSKKKSVQE